MHILMRNKYKCICKYFIKLMAIASKAQMFHSLAYLLRPWMCEGLHLQLHAWLLQVGSDCSQTHYRLLSGMHVDTQERMMPGDFEMLGGLIADHCHAT